MHASMVANKGFGDNGPLRGEKPTVLEIDVRESIFKTTEYIADQIQGFENT